MKVGWKWGGFCLLLLLSSLSSGFADVSKPNDKYENAVFKNDFLTPSELGMLGEIAKLVGLSDIEVVAILNLVKVGLGAVEFIDRIYSQIFNGSTLLGDLDSLRGADRQMLGMFHVLSYRLEQLQLGMHGIETSLRDIFRGLPHVVRWEAMLDSLEDYTTPINSLYHRFTHYQKHKDDVEEHTLLDFAQSVVSHETTSIMSLMASIHNMVAPDYPPIPKGNSLLSVGPEYVTVSAEVNQHYQKLYKEKLKKEKADSNRIRRSSEKFMTGMALRPSIFNVLDEVLQNYNRCDLKQSHQQMVLGLYSMVAITQARGYAMVNYAYMLLKLYDKGNFTVEQDLSRILYSHFSRNIIKTAQEVINRSSNKYSRCDPMKHVQGDTYVMFTELLQGHMENEVDLNNRGTCLNSCPYYEHAEAQGCFAPDQQVCGSRKKCKGTMHGCRFFHADASVCFSESPYRRYDWIEYENGVVLGTKNSCNDRQKVDSWWRWFVHCSYCLCQCDDPNSETTERYLSLLPTITDVQEGMVLTGIKMSKHNRVIMMEVQQGRAMPQGQVDPSSLEWIQVPPLNVKSSSFKEGRDYHTLTYGARSMDLDDLQAPADHVITGVRFRMLGTHANLEIKVTPINFVDGALNPGLSYWISNDNTPSRAKSPRTVLSLYKPDDPSKSTTASVMDSETDMYVEFQATDVYADVSQMTVPFFDAQPVTTTPASWMSGLNLYHKGRKGSGGFIALEVECYNASRHFEDTPVAIDL